MFQETDLLTAERQHAAAEPQSDEMVESDAAWRATTQRLPLALVVPGATRLHGRSTEVDWVDWVDL